MVEKRVGPVIRRLYGDVGDRILILNKNKKVKDNSHLNEVVCYKECFPNYGQKNEGSVLIQNYWIIGLAYSEFVCSRKDISLFFKYNNTTVFLQSSLKGLTDPSYIKVEYPQNRNQVNSQEAEKFFYKNAILCEQDSNGIFSFVTDEVKKRVDFVVPPIE